MYSHRRPINSDRGAMTMGPKASPSMYMVSERIATVRLTANSTMRAEVAGTVTDAENVLQFDHDLVSGSPHLVVQGLSTNIKKARKQGMAV